MLDWAESVPQNMESSKENPAVTLTSFTHPAKTWTASSSPRYCPPQYVTPADRTGHLQLCVILEKKASSLPEKEAPGGQGLEKGISHFILCRVVAGYTQALKPNEMGVPLVWI